MDLMDSLICHFVLSPAQVIQSVPQTGDSGEVVHRHDIAVLEVIKRVRRYDDDEDTAAFINTGQCYCPDKEMLFSELDILKLNRIASTTAALISKCNLFGNLTRKVGTRLCSPKRALFVCACFRVCLL